VVVAHVAYDVLTSITVCSKFMTLDHFRVTLSFVLREENALCNAAALKTAAAVGPAPAVLGPRAPGVLQFVLAAAAAPIPAMHAAAQRAVRPAVRPAAPPPPGRRGGRRAARLPAADDGPAPAAADPGDAFDAGPGAAAAAAAPAGALAPPRCAALDAELAAEAASAAVAALVAASGGNVELDLASDDDGGYAVGDIAHGAQHGLPPAVYSGPVVDNYWVEDQ
jgi:hypothetical protein